MDKGLHSYAVRHLKLTDVAVVTALIAQIAILPLNCTAASTEETAERSFWVGGMLG
jgi:hypothetical protein